MFLRDTVEFPHVPLGLVPEILDPVDVVPAVCKQFRVIYAVVFERTDIQRVVAAPAICVDDAVRNHLAFDDGHEGGPLRVRNDTCIDLSPTLEQAEDRDFPCGTSPACALAPAAEVAFVHFDLTAEHGLTFGFQFNRDDLAKAMKIQRCGIAVNTHKAGRCSGRCAGNEMFNQAILLELADTALSHSPFDTSKSGYLGQPQNE